MDYHARRQPLDALHEGNVQVMLQVLALGRPRVSASRRTASEKLGEKVPETALPRFTKIHPRKIEAPVEAFPGSSVLAPAGLFLEVLGIKTVLIVDSPFLGVAQHVVGVLDLLETLLRRLVPGIDVRVVLPRQAPVSFLDFRFFRVSRNAQDCVIIFLIRNTLSAAARRFQRTRQRVRSPSRLDLKY
jgi:hypothetical protein